MTAKNKLLIVGFVFVVLVMGIFLVKSPSETIKNIEESQGVITEDELTSLTESIEDIESIESDLEIPDIDLDIDL